MRLGILLLYLLCSVSAKHSFFLSCIFLQGIGHGTFLCDSDFSSALILYLKKERRKKKKQPGEHHH